MVSDTLKSLIGRKSKPVVYEVTRDSMRRIADAAGDRNPLYWDDEYAAASRFRGIIAPPDFFGWPVKWPPDQTFVNINEMFVELAIEAAKAGYFRAINAGMESEYFIPIRPGDALVLSSEIVAVEEKEGKKGGKMLISTVETTVINQNGDVVVKQRQSTIH
jgi:acyl dehydratase